MENQQFLTGKTVTVVGGGQGWGAKIAQAARGIAGSVQVIEKETDIAMRNAILQNADVVFLAAPDTEIAGILDETRALLQGKCILDCATNKGPFEHILRQIACETGVCSTHPMVRSETPSRGQTVLIMPVGNHTESATKAAEELYRSLEMRIHQFNFDQHGKMMAIVQFIPHLTQRTLIQILGVLLEDEHLSLQDLHAIAPANFQMTELGMGRVGIQRSDVSAGIIASALQSDFGGRILNLLQRELGQIQSIVSDRAKLSTHFAEGVSRLDPDNEWRKMMAEVTDIQLEAAANFGACSFTLDVERDEAGLLLKICSILAEHGINMTAVHSHIIEREEGKGVRFNIGIDEKDADWQMLENLLHQPKHGWTYARRK